MTAEKLIKCLEMMSSEHDGEALAAARKAHRLMKSMNMQWKDIIAIQKPQQIQPIVNSHHETPAWAQDIRNGYGGLGGMGGASHGYHPQQQYNPHMDPFAQMRAQGNMFMQQEAIRQMNEAARKAREQADGRGKENGNSATAAEIEERLKQKRKSFWSSKT